MKLIRFVAMMVTLICGFWAAGARATIAESPPVSINWIRSYMNNGLPAGSTGSYVFFSVSLKSPCPDTDTYAIDLSRTGGKDTYALVLAALLSGKQVKVEVDQGKGCTGWGALVQSVSILP